MEFNGTRARINILALIVGGLALRQLVKLKRRRDSELTSRTDDASGEENEALQRVSESTSRADDVSGEEYDVFLSFRGSDTRQNITDILYRSMVRAGIRVFLDNEEIKDGGKINEVLKAVKNSRTYIPIFSQHFADSVWCLREVECMVECHSKPNGNKEIIPIFYDVTPDDVKLKTNRYKKALCKHKENFFLSLFGLKRRGKYDSSQVQQWEKALQTVGRIFGRELQGKGQGKEIDSIVEVVSRKLNTGHVEEPQNLVEDIGQVQAIMKKLDVGSYGVRYVGIHGMGGIGKTTLAKAVYNRLRFHFEGCCFLENVRASGQPHDGVLNLQKKLLLDFVGSRITDQITDVSSGIQMIKRVLSAKRVLIVLDDIDKKEHLEMLAGKSDWFGSCSRIIFTTRNTDVLTTRVELSNEEPKRIFAYEVKRMEFHRALELFCKHAFGRVSPGEVYDRLAEKIVDKVDRLPLAIQVIGSYLYGLSSTLDSPDLKEKIWEETLDKLVKHPFENLREVLKISYNGLEGKEEKEVFLDIACFFANEDQTYPVIMWDDCNYYPHSAIRILKQRSLIKIMGKKLWMHDQVRDLGRYIVLEEHTPKFSRVWEHDAFVELLMEKERNKDVEALSLTSSDNSYNFADDELAALRKLRFLRVKGSDFYGDFDNCLLKLRWLSWQICGMTFRAKSFRFSELIVLDLSDSDMEDDWGGWSQMKGMTKLKVLDLTRCTKLTRTPDFSNFTSLEILIFSWCPKLITIDRSISKLELLKTLNIKGCSSLGELPEEVGSLHSLTEIVMPQNFQPLKLPERFGELTSLSSFTLDDHPRASQLPNSIGGLVKLTHLSLRGCVGITWLPDSIGQLQMLVELSVMKTGIVVLPDSIGQLKKLRVLNISYTLIKEFPCSIGGVEMLQKLYAKKCWRLTEKHLEEIGKLSNLKILDLSYTYILSLPKEIGHLPRLETLQFGSIVLEQLTALPSSLTRLEVQAIDFSIITDTHFQSLVDLHYLELYRLSTFLRKEPYCTWENDTQEMEEAFRKEQPFLRLPSSLSTLKVKGISPLPDFSNLESLTVLRVSEFPLSCLPAFEGLSRLTELKISRCDELEQTPDLSHLEKLQRLVLNSLKRLVKIPGVSELKSLKDLRLSRCPLIKELHNLSKLDKLQHLEVESCPMLRPIEGVVGLESWKLDSPGRTVLERLLDGSGTTWLCQKLPMYDVFLSFKGSDTRYSIIKFLRDSLSSGRVSFFRDDDELSPGEGIGEEIQQALENSRIYIPVFSMTYASSQWCLRGLEQMVKYTSESKEERKILPIFYEVTIDDVKLKSHLYRNALHGHREDFPGEVDAWEKALKTVAPIKGFDLNTISPEDMAQKIIAEVFRTKNLLDVDS